MNRSKETFFFVLFLKFVWFKQGDLAKKKIYPTLWWVKNCSTHTAATLITELCFKVVWSPCVMKSLTFGQSFLHCYLWIFQVVIQRRPSSRQHVFCGFCSVQLDCRGHQGSMSAPHEGNTFKGVWLLKIRFCFQKSLFHIFLRSVMKKATTYQPSSVKTPTWVAGMMTAAPSTNSANICHLSLGAPTLIDFSTWLYHRLSTIMSAKTSEPTAWASS